MNRISRFFLCVLVPVLLLCLSSCSKVIGYSVVRWTVSEYGLADGTIVPVYIKSNILRQYVIALPNSDEKVEIPFWMLTSPQSKSKAKAIAQKYAGYEHRYAMCVLDGLPVRQGPENGSKQVYRLRQDEIVRTLYKGEGVIPTSGKEQLKGEWLRVLTKDGTEGWCFSLNLRLFTMNSDGSYGEGALEADIKEEDTDLESLLQTIWYPDYYEQMISQKTIDLDYFSEEYCFDTGSTTGEIHLKLFNVDEVYPYSGVTKLRGGVYRFNDTAIQVTVRSATTIVVQYTDGRGKVSSYTFVKLADGIAVPDVIAQEKDRRAQEVASLVKLGPDFISSNYGTLTFSQDGLFIWKNYDELVPNVIARGSGNTGIVQSRYFLPQNLKSDWDGVLTFNFRGNDREINLLYKKASGGLRLSLARVSETEDSVTGRIKKSVYLPSSSLVMFFQNSESIVYSDYSDYSDYSEVPVIETGEENGIFTIF